MKYFKNNLSPRQMFYALRWIKALKSGMYTQSFKTLKTKESYCVFGVLCDTVYPEGWDDSEFHMGWASHPHPNVTSRVGFNREKIQDLLKQNDRNTSFEMLSDILKKDLYKTILNQFSLLLIVLFGLQVASYFLS